MLVNQKKKNWKKLVIAITLAAALIGTASAASAYTVGTKWAYLTGGNYLAKTSPLTGISASGYNGNVYVSNTGLMGAIKGYAYQDNGAWPDTNVANTMWFYPGNTQAAVFTQKSGKTYYGELVGEDLYVRGSLRLSVIQK